MATGVNERVQRHRENMRAAGMRQIHIWVPDTIKKNFAIECARQSRSIRGDAGDTDTQNWIEKAADTEGWA
ncbi:antitoxin MazE family protein [Kordiimonas pumila]|uniref:Antitoxin MazE family protein n=1 Tax=Kordiimonas pumila TaxID=2161677 RepID=A0ABV7D5R9_9PROT|nr:antitoxin MazE family protein [Kordiimonas pumila]